jgi:biopolymer transport protein TolR
MMMSPRRKRRPMAEINVVPYIDVMLVLLIIFMITAPLLNQGVQVELPKTKAATIESKPKEAIIVSVDKDGQFYLNISATPTEAIAATTLLAKVHAELQLDKNDKGQRSVLVKADRSVNYGQVMQAMVILQQAGAPSVGLVTDPNKQSSSVQTSVQATNGNAWAT